ncbi:MAG: anti-sigma factor, partial [Thermoanaerobaculia bacterium]
MSQETHREDDTILAALEALEAEAGVPSGARGDETAETLTRLYTEALGLLPYELPPATPRPEVKARLLASLQGTAEAAPAPAPAPAPLPALAPVPLRASQEISVPVPRSAVARRPSRWPLALAAALALLFMGLSIWLYTGLVQQNETIASLTRQVEDARRQAAQAVAQARESGSQLQEMRERFSLVTSPAVEVSPMRPVGELQPKARGILFVAADHQHWYLSLDGLQPADAGKVYTLWFEADRGAVNAGSFTARPGAPIELSSEHMPPGTRGVVVTLEAGPQAAAPTGPEVLRAA